MLKGQASSQSLTNTQLLALEDGVWFLFQWFGAWREGRSLGELMLQFIFLASYSSALFHFSPLEGIQGEGDASGLVTYLCILGDVMAKSTWHDCQPQPEVNTSKLILSSAVGP